MYYNSIHETEKDFKTNIETGLTLDEVNARLNIHGENKIESAKKKSFMKKLLHQFLDVMIIVLIIAGVVSFIINIVAKESLIEPIIISVIVIANALLGAIQETRAEKSLNALKKLTSKTARVLRDGNIIEIKATELVNGDICILQDGDIIPADLRIIQCSNLKVDESTLTGESVPLEKSNETLPKDTPLSSRTNMLYNGCTITSGNGTAIVVATGMNTELGKIAGLLNNEKHKKTPLQQQFAKLSLVLSLLALVVSLIVFVVGIAVGLETKEMFMNALSLAIATIPESLPAIITVILALGVERLVDHKAIVKNLPAIETLGSASIICSDKTGTLTQNKMTVVQVYDYKANMLYEDLQNPEVKNILALASLCCNGTKDIGDPTEKAILQTENNSLLEKYERIHELPFDSIRKLMTTIYKKDDQKYLVVTKGAFEAIEIISNDDLKNPRFLNNDLAENAIRVLGLAIKELDSLPSDLDNFSEIENNLNFVGLIGMIDPPKLEVKEAIQVCYSAGIRPIMITGDNPVTAMAIGRTLGIFKENDKVLTGEDLKTLSNEKLLKILPYVSIYARVTPEDKITIVKAWQKLGHIVAMTGDGVNDAPALKSADIGCVMGIQGSDVAKSSGDLILTDDNFNTIVSAVKEGRGIFNNIKRVTVLLLGTNYCEALTIILSLIFFNVCPIVSIQLLWINLVSDSFPAIALGLEKYEDDIMNEKPVKRNKKSIINKNMIIQLVVVGVTLITLSLVGFNLAMNMTDGNIDVARTVVFAILGLGEIMHAFNLRTNKSVFKSSIKENKLFYLLNCSGILLMLLILLVPPLTSLFMLAPLTPILWLYVGISALTPIILMEILKLLKLGKI